MHFPAALYLPADAFDVASNQVIGRRIAGRLLTRAFASGLFPEEMLTIFSPGDGGVSAVQRLIEGYVSPKGVVRVGGQPDAGVIEEIGAIHFPDPSLARWTSLRRHLHPAALSLTGVIHTVCSDGALRGLGDLPLAPVYPWDAVICTSTAGQSVVSSVFEQRLELMLSRFKFDHPPSLGIGLPRLPVIPLAGPTGQPFEPGLCRSDRRASARQLLGIPADHFVVAFVGRLSFHSKCHPLSLYRALDELAATNCGQPITLVECGHIFNPSIAAAYDQLRSRYGRISYKLVGGLDPASELDKWKVLAAADVFTSPADNLQETFGLTLLEAMMAELPLVVTDWNGYRDLVDDGVNGFLVPTEDVLGSINDPDFIEAGYLQGDLNYDAMIGLRSLGVIVDHNAYSQCFSVLQADPDLRQSMAQASLSKLVQEFSPVAVSSAYRRLYSELADLRAQAVASQAENGCDIVSSDFSYRRLFGHYATRPIALSPGSESFSVPQYFSVRSVLSDLMNESQLQRITGGRLQPLISLLESCSRFGMADLLALGFSDQQARLTLVALRKLGVAALINGHA